MAIILKLFLLCVIGFSAAQIIDDYEDPKVKQKWYEMNSMFIRYGYRAYGHCQLKQYITASDGRRIELSVQDLMTKPEHFFHQTARWDVDENADIAEIKFMFSRQQPPNETIFNIAKTEIESNTCIKFKKLEETVSNSCGTEGNIDYFCVYEEEGTCAAEYGQNLTKPALFSISNNCGQRGALREFGHILGLHHATSREDRIKFIDIAFKQLGHTDDTFFRRGIFHEYQSCNNSTEQALKLPYDYTSVMHQGLLDWSENYELVLTAHGPQYMYMIDYAQDFYPHMSHYDKLMLNKLRFPDLFVFKKIGF